MTPQTKKTFQLSVLTALAVALVLFLATEAREAVVPRSEYDLHVQSDSSWKVEQRMMTLDILCSEAIRPTDRRCR